MQTLFPIPGSGVLGWGFDVFGSYSSKEKIKQIFKSIDSGKTWQFSGTTPEYLLPENVEVENISRSSATIRYFRSRVDFENHFSFKARVEGSAGAFSGEFEASFSRASKVDTEYTFTMMPAEFLMWKLKLKNTTQDFIAESVKNDPDFIELPEKFTHENAAVFFRFFDKFGTHFVASVTLGYKLQYCSAIEKTFSKDESEIKVKAEAEYRAAFVSVGAEAQSDWNKVGQKWTENRTVSVRAVGGDSSVLDLLLPEYGDNYSQKFGEWKTRAEQLPAPVDFELLPMSSIFSGARADAVKTAYNAFISGRVYIEAKSDGSTIIINGMAQQPPTPPIQGSGFQVSVINRETLEAVSNQFVLAPWDKYWTRWPSLYNDMFDFLKPYWDPKYLVAIASRSMSMDWAPTEAMYQFFLSMGATPDLGGWLKYIRNAGSPYPHPINYAIVGIPGFGPGTGYEVMIRSNGTRRIYDLGNGNWAFSTYPQPPEMATVMVSLRKVLASANTHHPFLLRKTYSPTIERDDF